MLSLKGSVEKEPLRNFTQSTNTLHATDPLPLPTRYAHWTSGEAMRRSSSGCKTRPRRRRPVSRRMTHYQNQCSDVSLMVLLQFTEQDSCQDRKADVVCRLRGAAKHVISTRSSRVIPDDKECVTLGRRKRNRTRRTVKDYNNSMGERNSIM